MQLEFCESKKDLNCCVEDQNGITIIKGLAISNEFASRQRPSYDNFQQPLDCEKTTAWAFRLKNCNKRN